MVSGGSTYSNYCTVFQTQIGFVRSVVSRSGRGEGKSGSVATVGEFISYLFSVVMDD